MRFSGGVHGGDSFALSHKALFIPPEGCLNCLSWGPYRPPDLLGSISCLVQFWGVRSEVEDGMLCQIGLPVPAMWLE
jgi:hypothetical protein